MLFCGLVFIVIKLDFVELDKLLDVCRGDIEVKLILFFLVIKNKIFIV